MKTITHTLQLLLAMLLLSCETIIDYEMPREDPKIVIDAHIIGGDSVQAFVSISEYALSTERPMVDSSSTVYLYENSIKVAELKPEAFGSGYVYKSTYISRENNFYKVEALREGFNTAFGQTFLKEAVSVNILSVDTASGEISIAIEDPVGKGDYYRIMVYAQRQENEIIIITQDPFAESFNSGPGFEDIVEFEDANNLKIGEFFYLSDEYFDGSSRKFKFTIGNYYAPLPNGEYYLQVMRVSEDHYKHISSKILQDQSNDFFGEPVQVFSNIQNGYGIVAAGAPTTIKVYP